MAYSYKWVALLQGETGDPYQVLRTGDGQGCHLFDKDSTNPIAVEYREWVAAGGVTDPV